MERRRTSSFSCMMCGTICTSERSCMHHMKSKHGIVKQGDVWECPFTSCALQFPTFCHLREHGEHAHRNSVMDEGGPIICMDCDSGVFPTQACYIAHKRKRHVSIVDTNKKELLGCHEFQEGGRREFPQQHKFGNVYFEKREIYSESESPLPFSSFWASSVFANVGKVKDGGGGGAL